MASEIATALITAAGAIVLAGASYWFTKKREREAELRKEKLEHYKEFVASLSGILAAEGTPEGQRIFARACNKLNLVAPHGVLSALREFQREIKCGNPDGTIESHDKAMSKLFLEIRRDLNVTPADDSSTFKVGLWAAGVRPNEP